MNRNLSPAQADASRSTVEAEEQLSNRQRRLLAAIADLPELFPTNRDRGDGDTLSRDVTALRARLDWLVRLEEEHGEEQRGVHPNRAERNALIRTLQRLSEEVGVEAARGRSAGPGKGYDRDYIKRMEEAASTAVAAGYTLTNLAKPGLLFHKVIDDAVPQQVPMNVWFAVRGYTTGLEAA